MRHASVRNARVRAVDVRACVGCATAQVVALVMTACAARLVCRNTGALVAAVVCGRQSVARPPSARRSASHHLRHHTRLANVLLAHRNTCDTRPPRLQADRRALNITLNSIGTEVTRDERRKLYSDFGLLHPHGHMELAVAEDFDQIRAAMEKARPTSNATPHSLPRAPSFQALDATPHSLPCARSIRVLKATPHSLAARPPPVRALPPPRTGPPSSWAPLLPGRCARLQGVRSTATRCRRTDLVYLL